MTSVTKRWLAVIAMAAFILASSWLVRGWVDAGARQRLTQRYEQHLAQLSERQAARFIHVLATDQPPWLDVLVSALTDQRPAVATAAEGELRELVASWKKSPSSDVSKLAARLASLLAEHAQTLPPNGRQVAQVLAQSLVMLPIDSRQINVAKYISDCESVLLAQSTPLEPRVASVDTATNATSNAFIAAPQEPPPAVAIEASVQPQPTIQIRTADATAEPGRFIGPSVRRISER